MSNIDWDKVTSYPLTWPVAWPVAWPRKMAYDRARFGDHSMERAVRKTFRELQLLGVPDYSVIVSSNVALRLDGLPRSNQPRPDDPGVAVYFQFEGEPHVLACDCWDRPEHNLWAVAKHIEALRAQERWGVGTVKQAFTGYKALPPPSSAKQDWKLTLQIGPNPTRQEARDAYTRLAKRHHPDSGGDPRDFAIIADAWRRADEALR